MSMSVPLTKPMLNRPESAEALADSVSMPLMVLRLSSSGRTIVRSISSGEDERYVAVTEMLEEEKLVGVISIGDVVKAVISEQEFIIHQLENYISGTQ